MQKKDVLIVGAGACGLFAALQLAKKGKRVGIVEARDRIGGRICTLPSSEWGYPAEAGAEFVHGSAPLTKALTKEARLTFEPFVHEATDSFNEDLSDLSTSKAEHELVVAKLKELTEDLPLRAFLESAFPGEEFDTMRQQIIKRAEGYDAADASRISTFAVRDEWLMEDEWEHGRIREGYCALIEYLADQCRMHSVEIELQREVISINMEGQQALVTTRDAVFEADKVLVTVPLPLLSTIQYVPALPEKNDAVSNMGYGTVLKILLRFERAWWLDVTGKDSAKTMFFFSEEDIPTWWTQYPLHYPVLTGWLAGPAAEKLKDSSDDDILKRALTSLAAIFKLSIESIQNSVVTSHIAHWSRDPFSRGAYSYATPETIQARATLLEPIGDTLFFAGEALSDGDIMGTVEAAFDSAQKASDRMYQ